MYNFCKADEMLDKILEYTDVEDLEDIYDKSLTPSNYLSFKGMKLMMFLNPKKFNFLSKRRIDENLEINPKANVIISSLYKYLDVNGLKTCNNLISEEYILETLNLAGYIFILTTPIQVDGSCKLTAFRFLKEIGNEIPMILTTKEKGIHSILICAVESSFTKKKIIKKTVETSDDYTMDDTREMEEMSDNNKRKKRIIEEVDNVIVKAGFGQLITYHTLIYARNIGKDYYYMSSASIPLLRLYRKWGFHLGLPAINLDHVLDRFPGLENKKKEMTEEYENKFVQSVRKEILSMLKTDLKLLSYITGKTEEYLKEASYNWGSVMYVEYIDKIMEKIFNVEKNKFYMYFDLNEHEALYELKKMSLNKLKEYYD
jgi:hypothetical protein